jgi:hypothetical protein
VPERQAAGAGQWRRGDGGELAGQGLVGLVPGAAGHPLVLEAVEQGCQLGFVLGGAENEMGVGLAGFAEGEGGGEDPVCGLDGAVGGGDVQAGDAVHIARGAVALGHGLLRLGVRWEVKNKAPPV